MEIEKEIKQARFKSEFNKAAVNIVFTAGWLSVSITKILRPYGISMQQYNILRILRGQNANPVSVKMLQERMLDKMSNASRLVEKLRRKNYVERKENDKDRRQVDVRISQQGLDVLAELDVIMERHEFSTFKITEAQARDLNRLLDLLRG